MNIQFLGFEQNPSGRTYAFRVVEVLKQDREFRLSVDSQSLAAARFKIQDIPDLCFSKLKRDLASETVEQTLPLKMSISDAELRQYIAEHYPAKRKSG